MEEVTVNTLSIMPKLPRIAKVETHTVVPKFVAPIKLDEDALAELMKKDWILNQFQDKMHRYKVEEAERIAKMKEQVAKGWEDLREIKHQRNKLNIEINSREASLRAVERRMKFRTLPLKRIEDRIRARKRSIRLREEQRFLNGQRVLFRKEISMVSRRKKL